MRMDKERKSRNVDDRRKSSGGRRLRLPSMGTMMVIWPFIKPLLRTKLGWTVLGIGAVLYFSGYNPLSMIGMGGYSSGPVNEEKDEKEAVFISKTLANTEEVWNKVLPKYGIQYTEPVMVLYRGSTQSGCGYASAQMGPFYCPMDEKLYIDLGFFDELARRHDAPGDFAQAYVLSHEVGHHIQDLQGTLKKVDRIKRTMSERQANALQVRVELQADCYSGIWAHYAHVDYNIVEPGDVEEAIRAASSIGDDTLQRQTTGYVRPDGFTHGSSRQRVEWFKRGFTSGDLEQCNTFK